MQTPFHARGPVSDFPHLQPSELPPQDPTPPEPPVAACYLATFLKPEMLHVYRQITALRRYQPVVFTQKRENPDQFPFQPIRLHPKPRTHALRRLWQKQILRRPITIYQSEARALHAGLHACNASLLHVYFGHIGVHLLPLLESAHLPVLISFHGADASVDMERPSHRIRMQRALSLATLLLARSESLAAHLVQLGADPSKIRLHRAGIPLQQIPFQTPTPPTDGKWRCLQACRLIQKKGLPTTLRAFAEFSRSFPLAHLTLAGDGPAESTLRTLAAELGISSQITFTGFIPQDQLGQIRSQSHLFLHPSERGPDGDEEGVPNSMLEAMAGGLPILATRHGGIAEAVEHGVSGLLVAERDSHGLASAMLQLAGNPSLYRSLSAAGRDRVLQQFSLQAQAANLEAAYDEARNRFAARPPTAP